jgi:glycosyltransferase involved in cell wall biosynthesis
MRALIDYRPALRARSGAGEYVHELTRALAERGPARGWSVGVFTSSWKDRLTNETRSELGAIEAIDRRIPGKLLHLLWHRVERPSIERLAGKWDVVHAAHPLLIPAQRAAQVITIHDLDFLRHPERARAEIRRDYPALAPDHARRADRIVTSSHFSAGEIERELGIPRTAISVCPAGAPEWRHGQGAAAPGVPSDPYILFLGTLERRKNIGALLDAYEQLATDAPVNGIAPLVIAGAPTHDATEWMERARRMARPSRVIFTGYVPDSSRRTLYERAALFVLPSFHEGFGLPVLEAMSLGIPVVSSNRGSLPEVLGNAGLLVDPDDREALTAAMRRMLSDDDLRRACGAAGRERARQFTWRASADILLDAYEAAVETRRRRTKR